jgi:hypothetical protein
MNTESGVKYFKQSNYFTQKSDAVFFACYLNQRVKRLKYDVDATLTVRKRRSCLFLCREQKFPLKFRRQNNSIFLYAVYNIRAKIYEHFFVQLHFIQGRAPLTLPRINKQYKIHKTF